MCKFCFRPTYMIYFSSQVLEISRFQVPGLFVKEMKIFQTTLYTYIFIYTLLYIIISIKIASYTPFQLTGLSMYQTTETYFKYQIYVLKAYSYFSSPSNSISQNISPRYPKPFRYRKKKTF